jgi:predicted naringenin-chalcone synthase
MIQNKVIVTLASLSAVSGIVLATTSLASASTASPNNQRISHYQIQQDRLSAEATVLGLTESELTTELQSSSLKDIIAAKGLTKADFRKQVQAQIKTELASQGYSQTQIDKWSSHPGGKQHHHNKR